MIKNKKNYLKITILTIIIILCVSLITLFKGTEIISWAVTMYSAEEATEKSLQNPISVASWIARMSGGSKYTKLVEHTCPSRGDAGDNLHFLGIEDLNGDPNILCTGHGIPLRSKYNEEVKWTKTEHDATPVEAWILSELGAINIDGQVLHYSDTEDLYEGDEEDLEIYGEPIDGDEIFSVGTTGKYVRQKSDGKYYYVEITGDPCANIQNAWWNASPRQHKNRADDPSGLADEARKFQQYIEEVGGNTPVPAGSAAALANDGDCPIQVPLYETNDDGTFKVDYKVGIEPEKSEDLKVGFNAETNKYRIGPIKVYYERRIAKEGNRSKVDFCGMTHIILVGVDAEGNELLDSTNESIFIQNTNFEIVYKDKAAHEATAQSYLDTDETYPFPYNGEEFYIDIDYIDDLYAIKSCKFDFHYMTAKGHYEEYHGETVPDPDDPDPGDPEERQPLANATGPNERIDIDAAEHYLDHSHSGENGNTPAELDLFAGIALPLNTSMGGMVWIDHDEQKDQAKWGTLGLYDGQDTPAEANSVEVRVWKVKYEKNGSSYREINREKAVAWTAFGGEQIDFVNKKVYIDKDGKYKIPVIQVPSEEGLDTSKYRMTYDVEFVYDGQTYEATEFLVEQGKAKATGNNKQDILRNKLNAFYKTEAQTSGADKDYESFANSSYAVENSKERQDFDSYFTEVWGGNPITTEQIGKGENEVATKGYATGGIGVSSQFAKEEYAIGVSGNAQVNASLEYNANLEGEAGAQKTRSKLITHNKDGFVYDQFKFAARSSEGGLSFPYETKIHIMEHYDNEEMADTVYKPVYEYFNQINLGLLERREADIGVMKDLYMANVVVNEHLSSYRYNKLGKITNESLTLQETLKYRKQKYTVDLYNSDYNYRSSSYLSIENQLTRDIVKAIKTGSELQLFLTYRIQFTNESAYTNVSINEFKDYYDKSFTLITNEMCSSANEDINNQNRSGNEVANNDGKFQKYITSMKAAGTDTDTEVSREARTVAYAPYYRKLTTRPDPDANNTNDQSNGYAEYYWNRDDDIDKSKVSIVETAQKIVDVKKGSDEGGYHTFTYSDLTPANSINSGKLPTSDALVIEPNETIEFYVSYQVDLEGYKIASSESEEKTEEERKAERPDLTGEKSNIVEITKYSTGYNDKNEPRHQTVSYSNDNISGRIDQDSAPGNMNITKVDNFEYTEDDNEYAPRVEVIITDETRHRTLDGTVWEDSRSDNTVGNGIYDEGTESGIEGVDVTMVEKIRVTKQDLKNKGFTDEDINGIDLNNLKLILDSEFEYIWRPDQMPEFNSMQTSGDKGYYKFENFPAGIYVVRFEYGNDVNEIDLKYNGQDYKNTTYQVGAKNPEFQINDTLPRDDQNISSDTQYLSGKSTLNNEWHDLSKNEVGGRVSDARDYEPQRMRVIAYSRTITNKNAEILSSNVNNAKLITTQEDGKEGFDNVKQHTTGEYQTLLSNNQEEFVANTRMVANTAKLYVSVEKEYDTVYKNDGTKTVITTEGDSTNDANTSKNKDHTYAIKNIDFGLVERPETRVNVRKEIEQIKLLKEDGEEPILTVTCDENGNIIKDKDGTIRVEKVTEIEKKDLGEGQGFKYIAMESNLLNGLQVKLTYRIQVFNNSEKDYVTGTLDNIKNISKIYRLADNFENRDTERLYSDGINCNVVPFINGKGIIYGRYLGTYYYTNDYIESHNDINNRYAAVDDGGLNEKYGTEVIVKTTVDQVIDYIDNDLSIDLDTLNIVGAAWVASSESDRENKLSEVAYRKTNDTYEKDVTSLQDDKKRAYVTKDTTGNVTKNNLYVSSNDLITAEPVEIEYTKIKVSEDNIPEKEAVVVTQEVGKLETVIDDSTGEETMELKNDASKKNLEYVTFATAPVELDYLYTTKDNIVGTASDNSNGSLTSRLEPGESGEIRITTTVTANEEAINSMNYDNLVEIVMYSNSVGRRDMQSIPGNANLIAKDFKAFNAGYNYYVQDANSPDTYTWKAKEVKYEGGETIYTERDAYAAKDTITFSEPTGLSIGRQHINAMVNMILTILLLSAIATTIIIVVIVVRKKAVYDDNDLLN